MKPNILVLCLFLLCRNAVGQTISTPPAVVASSIAQLQKQYEQSFVYPSILFDGPEYIDYTKRYAQKTGHQFFISPEKQRGSVYYNDHLFQGLQLSYDILLDQLVVQMPTNPLQFRLVNEKVDHFTVAGHRFTRIVADSLAEHNLSTGFYEVLADSSAQLLAKRAKRLQKQVRQGVVSLEFVSTDKLFLKKSGRYYPVKSKGSVLRLLNERSKELQSFMRTTSLRFSKATREADITKLVRFYNSLSSGKSA